MITQFLQTECLVTEANAAKQHSSTTTADTTSFTTTTTETTPPTSGSTNDGIVYSIIDIHVYKVYHSQ